MPAPKSPRLMFLHVPKTAGTSIRLAIQPTYPRSDVIWVYPNMPWACAPDDLGDLPETTRASARMVFGHMPYGVHEHFEGPFTYAAVLRDPVDRVISLWFRSVRAARRKARKDQPLTRFESMIQSGEIGMREFVESLGPDNRLTNQQTRLLAGREDGVADPALLQAAKSNVEREFLGVGMTDNVQEFVDVLAPAVGWGSDVVIGMKNTNQVRRSARAEPDADIVEIIRRRNALDLELVAWVSELTDGGKTLIGGHGG